MSGRINLKILMSLGRHNHSRMMNPFNNRTIIVNDIL